MQEDQGPSEPHTTNGSMSTSKSQSPSISGHYARQLNEEEMEKLKRQDARLVSAFKQGKLEAEASKNWDKFYQRNETRFFKDRHWTTEEFKELCPDLDWQAPMTLLEAGCGVGNLLFPFLEAFPSITFSYACDFSKKAIELLNANAYYDSSRCTAFVCDLTAENNLISTVPANSIDLCTLIFVLSAMSLEKMPTVVRNLHKIMKPGGSIIVRDYGLYDYAMIRFEPGQKLAENAYVRQDGTRSYYFSEETLSNLFTVAGFECSKCYYVQKETVNRKEDICVPRIFIQARFIKR